MGKKNKKPTTNKQNGRAETESEPASESNLNNDVSEDLSDDASQEVSETPAATEIDTKEVSALEAKLEQLQITLTAKDKEIDTLREAAKVSDSEKDLKNTQLRDERDRALSELKSARESISEANTSHGANSDLLSTAQETAKGHVQRINELESQLTSALKAKEDSDRQYQNLLGKIGTIKSTLGERLKTDAAELAKCREQVKILESSNKALTESMETLKRELITSTRENDSLSQQLSATRSEYQTSIGQWEYKHDTLTRENRTAREEAEKQQNLAKSLEVSLLEENTLRTSLGSKISDLEDQIASQTNYAEQYRRERDEMKAYTQKLTSDHQAESKTISSTISSLTEQMEKLKDDLQKSQEDKDKQSALMAELEKKAGSVPELEREVKEKSLQLGKLRHEAVTLNEHLTKALRMIQKNSQGDTVDKQLVTNMLLSFLSLPRADTKRFEVLQLISNYLSWDDEQNIQAGLRSSGASGPSGMKTPMSPVSRNFPMNETVSSGGFMSMFADFLERESTSSRNSGR